MILDSGVNQKSRTDIKLSRIKSRIESRQTENKRFTHDWFCNNFTLTEQNTAWFIHASDRMLHCLLYVNIQTLDLILLCSLGIYYLLLVVSGECLITT